MYQNEQDELKAKMLEEAEKVVMELTDKVYNRKDMPSDFVDAMEHLCHMLPEDMPLPEPFFAYKRLKFNKRVFTRLEMFETSDVCEDYKRIQF